MEKRKVYWIQKKKMKSHLCSGHSFRDFTYIISFIFQTIFWSNGGVKGKQLAQGHTAGSGRDEIWTHANIIPVIFSPIYDKAISFLYYIRKAGNYQNHFPLILSLSDLSLPTYTGTVFIYLTL